MPELPEVEMVVRGLRSRIMGKTLTAVALERDGQRHMLRTSYPTLTAGICLQTVQTVLRRGKYILIPLSNNNVLVLHLGMTGRLLVQDLDEAGSQLIDRWDGENLHDQPAHCRMVLEFWDTDGSPDPEWIENGVGVSFCDPRMFGKIWMVPDAQDIENLDVPGLRNLGPDALDATLEQFSGLVSKGRRLVKSFLLDQTKLAGVGNIYADEACFVAKIHPGRVTSSLDKAETAKLWFAVKTVLREGIHYGGSSVSDYTQIDGQKGSYQQKHRVYGKAGVACVECATPVERTKLVGRSTHFCPSCQPLEK